MLKKSAPTFSPSRFESKSMRDLSKAANMIMEQSAQLKYGGGFMPRSVANDPRKKTGTAQQKFKGSSDPLGMVKYGVLVPGAVAGLGEILDKAGQIPGLSRTMDLGAKGLGATFVGGSLGLDFLKDLFSGSKTTPAPSTTRTKFSGI
jgi:hypothetical protein